MNDVYGGIKSFYVGDLVSSYQFVPTVKEETGEEIGFSIVGAQVADISPFPSLIVDRTISNFNFIAIGLFPALNIIKELLALSHFDILIESSVVYHIRFSTSSRSDELDIVNGSCFASNTSACEV